MAEESVESAEWSADQEKAMDALLLRRCVKCGAHATRVTFSRGEREGVRGCPGSTTPEGCDMKDEHIHLDCSCGYRWRAHCLDAGT